MANEFNLNRPVRSATRSAINKTLRKAFAAASRKVREIYNIKAGDLRKYTKIRRATNIRPDAEIRVRGQRLPVFLFAAKPKPKGVMVKIKKKGGRKLIESAFIETMPSGKRSVFRRKEKTPGILVGRLPIRLLTTLDPVKMFEQEGEKEIRKTVNENLRHLFESELKFYLSKVK
jgi:hypothetical protein